MAGEAITPCVQLFIPRLYWCSVKASRIIIDENFRTFEYGDAASNETHVADLIVQGVGHAAVIEKRKNMENRKSLYRLIWKCFSDGEAIATNQIEQEIKTNLRHCNMLIESQKKLMENHGRF